MNYWNGFTPKALALGVGLAMDLMASPAMALNDRIPGIDIVVQKNPGGIPFVARSDASGRFALRLTEPGSYTFSTACREPSACPAHTLAIDRASGTGSQPGEAPIIAILVGLLLPAQARSPGAPSLELNVDQRGLVVHSDQFQSAPGVRVAAGDVNGDGVEPRQARADGGEYLTIVGQMDSRGLNATIGDVRAPASDKPIPNVDIYLGKNPGGIAIKQPTDAFGRFSLRLTEPGNYTISTACRQPCAPHGISATYSGDANYGSSSGAAGSGPAIAILVGLLLPAVHGSAPVATSFTVDKRGLAVSGQLPSAEGTYFIGTANGGAWKTLAEINVAKPAGTTDSFGQPVTFTATVVPVAPGAGTPTGTVTFRNSEGVRIAENESPRPTDRRSDGGGFIKLPPGIYVAAGDVNGDGLPEQRGAGDPSSGRITGLAVDPADPSRSRMSANEASASGALKTRTFTPTVNPVNDPPIGLQIAGLSGTIEITQGGLTVRKAGKQEQEYLRDPQIASGARITVLSGSAEFHSGMAVVKAEAGDVFSYVLKGTEPQFTVNSGTLIVTVPGTTATLDKGDGVSINGLGGDDARIQVVSGTVAMQTGGKTVNVSAARPVVWDRLGSGADAPILVPGKPADIFDRWGNVASPGGFGSGPGTGFGNGIPGGAMGSGGIPGAAGGGAGAPRR